MSTSVASPVVPVASGLPDPDTGWVLATALVATRLGALSLLSPAFGGTLVPAPVRVMLVLALAAVLAGGLSFDASPSGGGAGALILAFAREASLGAALALGVSMAFAVFGFGGRLVDLQIGFGLGQVFDPTTRQATPVFGALAGWLGLLAFFLSDAHHGLMRGIVLSLEAVPPGAAWPAESLLAGVAGAAARMTSLGFAIFAPVVLCLLVAEFALGFASRSLPQMNTLVVGMPVKVLVGIGAMAALASSASWPLGRIHAGSFEMWSALWR